MNFEFNQSSYEEMGEHLVNGLFEYLMLLEEDERRKRLKEIERKRKKKIKKEMEIKHAQAIKEAKKAESGFNAEISKVNKPSDQPGKRKRTGNIFSQRDKSLQ